MPNEAEASRESLFRPPRMTDSDCTRSQPQPPSTTQAVKMSQTNVMQQTDSIEEEEHDQGKQKKQKSRRPAS